MAIFPLMITAIISGLINIESEHGTEILGAKTLIYFFATTIVAILTGMVLAVLFTPGMGAPMSLVSSAADLSLTSKTFSELIIDIIPDNPFRAFAEGQVLAIITFTTLLGYFMSKLTAKPKSQLVSVVNPLFDAILKLTTAIMWTAPIGVFGYNAKVMATTGLDGFIFHPLIMDPYPGASWFVPLDLTTKPWLNPNSLPFEQELPVVMPPPPWFGLDVSTDGF